MTQEDRIKRIKATHRLIQTMEKQQDKLFQDMIDYLGETDPNTVDHLFDHVFNDMPLNLNNPDQP